MEVIAKLGSLLGLSFIAGINLYATVAVVGICVKFQLVQNLPPEFQVLANDAVIFVAIFLYLIEFLMDKIPGLDTLWDAIHTVIRPLGGAMLALMQVGEASPVLEVIAFMVGAGLASVAHVTKTGTRLIINTSPEPFSNFLASTGEDLAAIGYSYLTLAYPKLSFFLTLACLTTFILVLPLVLRTFRMLFAALLFRGKCLFHKEAAWMSSRSLPMTYDIFFDKNKAEDEKLLWAGRAYAIRGSGIARFTPLQVVVSSKAVHLIYRHHFRLQEKVIPRQDVSLHKSYPGLLLAKWLLRTTRGDWLLQLYQPLAVTLPQTMTAKDELDD